jgi:hypothetical protein
VTNKSAALSIPIIETTDRERKKEKEKEKERENEQQKSQITIQKLEEILTCAPRA